MDEIKIHDLYHLAALDYLHVPELRRERSQRYYGIFDKVAAKPVLDQFDSGTLTVNVRSFCDSIRRVKDRVFQGKKAGQPIPVQEPNALAV